jgi:hypothetical protein
MCLRLNRRVERAGYANIMYNQKLLNVLAQLGDTSCC